MLQFYVPPNWFGKADPVSTSVIVGVIGIGLSVALISIYMSIRNQRLQESGPQPSLLSRFGFRSRLRSYGFTAEQVRFFDGLIRQFGIVDPKTLLTSPKSLDSLFKRAYSDIDKTSETESIAEARKAVLFSIRQLLGAAQTSGGRVFSTRQLSAGQEFSFITGDESSYPSRILGTDDQVLYAELPKDGVGRPVDLKRGEGINCSFYARGGTGYTFPAKIRGVELRKSRPVMAISHSDAVKELPHRRHVRKVVEMSCLFLPVTVEEVMVNGKKMRKVVPTNRQLMGTIIDISAGGCSLRSATPLRKNDYLKIEFDVGQSATASALGIVRKMNQMTKVGGIMHVQFTRLSQKSLNAILSQVYGY